MQRLFLSLILFLNSFDFSFAQQKYTLTQEKDFSSYLFEKHLYSDCHLLLNEIEQQYDLNTNQRDSLNFFHAIIFSKLDRNDSAANRFAIVSKTSSDHYFSGFNASLKLAELHKVEESQKLISNYQPGDSGQVKLKELYLNSLLLLDKDLNAFDLHTSNDPIARDYFSIRNAELKKYEARMKKANKRSSLLAGLMSAVIPGTGKIYAGKWRQGLVSMIPLTLMGLQTYEAYRMEGIKSARFIVFGSMFSVFYIGNIYGSAVSVSVRKTEIEHEVHDEVVLSLRMSLQHVFGKSY